MAHSPHRQWKGCALCKMHKHKGNGDAVRMPTSALRQFGRRKRVSRNDLPRQEDLNY